MHQCAVHVGHGVRSRWTHMLVAALALMPIGTTSGSVAQSDATEIADYFRYEDTFVPRNHFPVVVQAWDATTKELLDALLAEAIAKAPGLLGRALTFGPIELYLVKEGRGATAGIATANDALNAIFFTESFREVANDTRKRSQILQTFVHETTHLADKGMRFSNHPGWTGSAQELIDRVRAELRLDLSTGAPGVDDLPKKRIARRFGLASAYAAVSLQEALAEVTADIVTDVSYMPPPELRSFVETHLLSDRFEPDHAALKYSQALRHWHDGAMTLAKADLDDALRIDATFAQAYLYRGLTQESYREPAFLQAAAADFTKSIEYSFGENAAEAYLRRGRLYLNVNQYELAEKDLDKHFELRPYRWESHFFRGLPRLYLGKLDPALADFNHAAAFRVKHPFIFYFRGETYRRMEQCEKAIDDYGTAIEYNIGEPDRRPYEGRAICNATLQDYDAAIADYTSLIMIAPDAADYHLQRARLWQKKDDFAQALIDLNASIELDSTLVVSYELRAEILQALDRMDEAKDDLDRLVSLDPAHPRRYAVRGELLERMDRCDDAIADYSRAIELAPDIAWAFARRAECRIKLNDAEGAIADLTAVISLQPESIEALINRARLYDESGRHAEAIADLETLRMVDPSRAAAIDRLIAHIEQKM